MKKQTLKYYPPKGVIYKDNPDLLYYEWDGKTMWRVFSWVKQATQRTPEQFESGMWGEYTKGRPSLAQRVVGFIRRVAGLDSENAGSDAPGETETKLK